MKNKSRSFLDNKIKYKIRNKNIIYIEVVYLDFFKLKKETILKSD